MNPLFQQQTPQQSMPNNIMQQFQQFRQSFNGDGNAARQQIQQMLNSGRVSQEQYGQAVQFANQFAGILGMR